MEENNLKISFALYIRLEFSGLLPQVGTREPMANKLPQLAGGVHCFIEKVGKRKLSLNLSQQTRSPVDDT